MKIYVSLITIRATAAKFHCLWKCVCAAAEHAHQAFCATAHSVSTAICSFFGFPPRVEEPQQPQPQRRCFVVVSTNSDVMGAHAQTMTRHVRDLLGDMRIPATLLALDPKEHKYLFAKYNFVSKHAPFPRVFVENADTGLHCSFISNERLEEIASWTSLDPTLKLSDETLDKANVPKSHRADHVFKHVQKDPIGIVPTATATATTARPTVGAFSCETGFLEARFSKLYAAARSRRLLAKAQAKAQAHEAEAEAQTQTETQTHVQAQPTVQDV